MARRKGGSDRIRVGKVTLYLHHGAWWIYFSEGAQRVRRKVGESLNDAEILAAQTNLQLAQGAPTVFSFQPLTVTGLRQQFLDYHEYVLKSSVATLTRYRTATQHLENFAGQLPRPPQAQVASGHVTAPPEALPTVEDAVALQARPHAVTHFGGYRRHRRQAPRQRLEVQTGAADEHRQAFLRERFRQHV